MVQNRKYFKICDLIIYFFFILFFSILGAKTYTTKVGIAEKVEIYVDGDLKYVYPLQKNERNVFVDTVLGGVNVKFKDNKVRVTSSNSPLKINVKRGWIEKPGEMIIGIPDRLLIKVVGQLKEEEELDYIVR